MELNKCSRCGAFFASDNSVCPKCELQDKADIEHLKNFLTENNNEPISIDELACNTGISQKNLNRFLSNEDFSQIDLNSIKRGNVSINL